MEVAEIFPCGLGKNHASVFADEFSFSQVPFCEDAKTDPRVDESNRNGRACRKTLPPEVLSGKLVRKHQLPFQARFEDVIIEIQDPIQAIENDLNPTFVQILFVHLQWEARIEPDT
jgi:hypothetical protein